MESDAWRCRRTDGKKWRCGMSVVAGQKYCHRHMHRGRLRSRKAVEAAAIALERPAQTSADLHPSSSKNALFPAPTLTQNNAATDALKLKRSSALPATLTTDLCPTPAANNNNNVLQPHGLDFSPKSVLPVERCFHGVLDEAEAEAGRCRRTDGKKWRCRRHVLPSHKYCERHLHRGAKPRPQTYPQPPKLPTIATHTAAPPVINTTTSTTSSDATISDDATFIGIASSANSRN
ncbi:unnamed protein product [Linum tenue]|uniref:Growth-regulating factor n=1 Tax=Linum tenue TaxID=586396 RepID=A0AAV0IWA6_9ROSI|nr:unnamed protein product [Linum tenue]